jgi:hypothetical protein
MIDIQTINDLLVTAAWATPLVTGLVQAAKVIFVLDSENRKRWVPGVALAIGVLVGVLVTGPSLVGVAFGLITGLTSVGLWEVGQKGKKLLS